MDIGSLKFMQVHGMIFTESYSRTSWGEKALNIKVLQFPCEQIKEEKDWETEAAFVSYITSNTMPWLHIFSHYDVLLYYIIIPTNINC